MQMNYILVAIIVVAAGYLAYKITSSANKQGKTVGCGSCGKGALPLRPSKKDFTKHQYRLDFKSVDQILCIHDYLSTLS